MSKNLILLFAGLLIFQISMAQTAIAKLKFEDAEEAFEKNDYKVVLTKLDEAEKLFGQTNPPILYLRIIAQSKNISLQDDIDIEDIAMLRSNCTSYLKNYEHIEGIEEKYKEVYKVYDSYKEYEPFDNIVNGAKAGNIEDIVNLGRAYKLVSNTRKATEWLMLAVNQQNALAMNNMGNIAAETGTAPEFKKDYVKAMNWYSEGAKLNEPSAMFNMGRAYYYGIGIQEDTVLGNEWLTKCYSFALKEAEKGNVRMMIIMSYLYNYPLFKNDNNQSFVWCSKAVEKGSKNILDNGRALQNLGDYYATGKYVSKNLDKALSYYEQAISNGNFLAMGSIGSLYNTADYKDEKKAFEWNLKAAEKGNIFKMTLVGNSYRNAKGVNRDFSEAMKWYSKASRKGDISAMITIGDWYLAGSGVPQSYPKALEWYLMAADKGLPSGYYKVGYIYYYGKGVTQDYNTALQWFLKGAEKNDLLSILYAADSYRYGPKDYSKAMEWYLKAMDNGSAYAIASIGDLYYEGLGVTKDYTKAFEYYLKAADKGNTDAMAKLTTMYAEGKGVKKDKSLAKEWQAKYDAVKTKQ